MRGFGELRSRDDARLGATMHYAQSTTCRLRTLVSYFGELAYCESGGCDAGRGRCLRGEPGAILTWMTAKPTLTDPVEEAFLNAPEGDPLTDEERRLLAEARESRARGARSYSQAEAEAVVAELRRKQEG